MALFDYTPAQPQQPQQQQQQQQQYQPQQQPQATSNPFQGQNASNQAGYAASNNPFPSSSPQQQYQQAQQPQLSAAAPPVMGNKNPFASMGPGQQQQQYQTAPSLVDTSVSQQKPYNASRESMMAVGLETAKKDVAMGKKKTKKRKKRLCTKYVLNPPLKKTPMQPVDFFQRRV